MLRKPNHSLVRRVVYILIILLFLGVGLAFYFGLIKIPKPDLKSDIQIGLRAQEIGIGETIDSITGLEFWVDEYRNSLYVPLVAFSLDYIYVNPNTLNGVYCIGELKIISNDVAQPEQTLIQDPGICLDTSQNYKNYILGYSNKFVILAYNPYGFSYSSPYRYPFDSRSLHFRIFTKVYTGGQMARQYLDINPDIVIATSQSKIGRESWTIVPDPQIQNGKMNFMLTLTRPIKYQALTVVILITLGITILSLLLVEESFWEVAVGILLGLWGIQDVLIPKFVDPPTIVSDFVLFLYFLLSVVILLHISGIPNWILAKGIKKGAKNILHGGAFRLKRKRKWPNIV